MKPKEFIIWLRGVEVGLSGHPYEGLWSRIMKKLDEVDIEELDYDKHRTLLPDDFPPPLPPIKIPPSPGSPPEIIC